MRVAYLTGERIYLRSLMEEDVDHAIAWYGSPFPINASRAKTFLDEQPLEWWTLEDVTLVIVRTTDDEPVGAVKLSMSGRRVSSVRIHIAPAAPDADAVRVETVRIVVPWLRDEHEYMVVRLHVAADERETIAVAEELGMQPSVRLREFVARGGHRVDEIVFEAFNTRWEVPNA